MSREVVQLEPCYLLHQRPYRDSSRLVDVFAKEHGRVSLVARGVRRPRSKLRSVLMPFQPIFVSWVRRTDLGTLTDAEAAGGPPALAGDSVLSGFYLNELLLRLLESGEAQTELFAGYADALAGVAVAATREAALRRFEKRLLDNLGYGLVLQHEAGGTKPIDPARYYRYHAQSGPSPAAASDADALPGAVLLAIADERFDDAVILTAARRLLRESLRVYLGDRPLRVRQVAMAMNARRP